jgi:hypothetical protein
LSGAVIGDWADASSWATVIKRLQEEGFTVVAPANLLRGPGRRRGVPRQLPRIRAAGVCER